MSKFIHNWHELSKVPQNDKYKIDDIISNLDILSVRVVEELPTIGLGNIVYMVGASKNLYEQWIFSKGAWRKVGSILVEMSEADRLFEELGYNKKQNKEDEKFHIEYIGEDATIQFWHDKTISKIGDALRDDYCITMQELKAINMKCKELGWSDE